MQQQTNHYLLGNLFDQEDALPHHPGLPAGPGLIISQGRQRDGPGPDQGPYRTGHDRLHLLQRHYRR